MSTKRFTLFVVAAIILIASPPVHAMPNVQDAGDMYFYGYCQYLGYEGARIDPTQTNVNSWGCVRPDGTLVGLDLYDLCEWMYRGRLPYPEYSNYSDPYSWYCSSEDLGSPAPRPGGGYQTPAVGGLCPGYDYSEGLADQYLIDAGGVLRKEPSILAKIIKELPYDGFGNMVDGPRCSPNTMHCSNLDRLIWYQLEVDGVVGWYTSCDPVYGYAPHGWLGPSAPGGTAPTPSTESESTENWCSHPVNAFSEPFGKFWDQNFYVKVPYSAWDENQDHIRFYYKEKLVSKWAVDPASALHIGSYWQFGVSTWWAYFHWFWEVDSNWSMETIC